MPEINLGVFGAVGLENQTAGLCADGQYAPALRRRTRLLSASFEEQLSTWCWAC
jgi:hypothetical protein